MIVCLTGFMGSGKSCVGKELSRLLGWRFVDLDEYISHKAGKSVPELVCENEDRFRALEAEAVRDIFIMSRIEGFDAVLSLGGGTLLNPETGTLVSGGSTLVFLKASLQTLQMRLQGTSCQRPLLAKEGIAELMQARQAGYELASVCVDTDGKSPAELAEEILGIIR